VRRPPLRTVHATLTAHGSSNSPLKMRCPWLLTVLLTLCQSMAFRSVGLRPSAPFAKSSGLASNFHLEVGFLHNVLRAAHLLIASAPFRVRLMCPIRQVMVSPCLSADPAFASRSFLLPLGIWAFLAVGLLPFSKAPERQTPSGFTRSA
jgi:hypothetical protein